MKGSTLARRAERTAIRGVITQIDREQTDLREGLYMNEPKPKRLNGNDRTQSLFVVVRKKKK